MNFKACTFERLTFISLGFGRGLKLILTLEVNLYGGSVSVDFGRIHFFILYASGPGVLPKSLILEEDAAFFLQCEAKIVRRHTS